MLYSGCSATWTSTSSACMPTNRCQLLFLSPVQLASRARSPAPPPPAPCWTFPLQDFNDGSAPFPYATECTAAAAIATCDPATLVAEMDFSGSADPIALDIAETTTADGAVELVRRSVFVRAPSVSCVRSRGPGWVRFLSPFLCLSFSS